MATSGTSGPTAAPPCDRGRRDGLRVQLRAPHHRRGAHLRFDAEGQIIDAYRILDGTNVNCAGGPTPWGTWLSCEEVGEGRVFETDPWGEVEAVERPALGRFKHEAATIDPELGCVYLSEDESDGCFYRFVSSDFDADGNLSLTEGELQVAVVDDAGGVSWLPVPDPLAEGDVPTRQQVPEATVFDGGEGIWWFEGTVYLSTKGDSRVWAYDTRDQTIRTIYDRAAAPDPDALYGVDNLTVSACGDVLVAEDGGLMRIVAVLPSGEPEAARSDRGSGRTPRSQARHSTHRGRVCTSAASVRQDSWAA